MKIITTVCAKLSKLTILGLEVLNVSIHRYTAGVRIKRQLNFVPVPWEFCHHEVKTPVRVLSSWNKKKKILSSWTKYRILSFIPSDKGRPELLARNLTWMSWYVMSCHWWWPWGQHLAKIYVEWLNLISAVSWKDWAQCSYWRLMCFEKVGRCCGTTHRSGWQRLELLPEVEQKLETYRIPAKVDVDIEKPVQ